MLLLLAGILVEVAGTVVTLLGLRKTYRTYSKRPFVPWSRVWSWFKFKVLRRPLPRWYAEGAVTGTSERQREGIATWRWTPNPPEDETIEERLDRMQGEILAVRDHGLDTSDALAAQRRTLKRVEAAATREVATAKAELTRQGRDQATQGLRQAAVGLVLIGAGSLAQAIGSIVSR